MTAIQKAREALVAARDTLSAASRQLTDDHKIVLGGKRWGEVTSAKIAAALAALDAETEVKVRKQFPILNAGKATIDWQLVADHGARAKANHYQTVERLAERGGLAWQELYAVLHDKPFAQMDLNTAMMACRALEARYLAALVPPESRS